MENLGGGHSIGSDGGEHASGEDTEESMTDAQQAWERTASGMSDEDLKRTRAELKARIDELGYQEGVGLTGIVEPEDMEYEAELQDCLAAVFFEEGGRLADRQLRYP